MTRHRCAHEANAQEADGPNGFSRHRGCLPDNASRRCASRYRCSPSARSAHISPAGYRRRPRAQTDMPLAVREARPRKSFPWFASISIVSPSRSCARFPLTAGPRTHVTPNSPACPGCRVDPHSGLRRRQSILRACRANAQLVLEPLAGAADEASDSDMRVSMDARPSRRRRRPRSARSR